MGLNLYPPPQKGFRAYLEINFILQLLKSILNTFKKCY